MKKWLVIFLAVATVILAAIVVAVLRGDEDTWLCQNGQWAKHGNPSASQPIGACPGAVNVNMNTNTNTNVGIANPASANCVAKGGQVKMQNAAEGQTGVCVFNDDTRCEEWAYFRGQCQAGKNIAVFSPPANGTVSLPFIVIGEARVFESTFNYELKDDSGAILASGIAMAQSPDAGQFGLYEIKIDSLLAKPKSNQVILTIFDSAAKDGERVDEINIPLTLELPELSTVKVYFNNDKLDPTISCDKVFSVNRLVPKTATVGQAAIEQLIKGPALAEMRKGYRTNIFDGVVLKSLVIADGVAKADFNETLEYQAGGSCLVSAVRAQITQTLLQFPTVKKVVIAINGRTEDILQP